VRPAEHLVAYLHRRARTCGVDDARQFHARTLRHRLLTHLAFSDLPVDAVDRRHLDGDAHLARPGLR
jgi:integrase